ncbi:hypothetical protein DL765_009279 [Monosporascus sp. GIB2]|nr:hypothetical protein DL765_009279 [Monosporascus sp. GIB2]
MMSNLKFDKQTIPDLAERVVLVTGGTGGIGAEIVVELAKHHPGRIIFTGRNAQSAEATIKRVQTAAPGVGVCFVPCDLASLASVKDAANKILSENSRLDLFPANAGIMAKPAGLSVDGYEIHFATNHLGHALLTQKLLPLLEKTADIPYTDVRIIYTTSTAWRGGSLAFDKLKTPMESVIGRWIRYGNSKLANLMYARELARRYPKLLSFSVTPGVVGTSLVTDLKFSDRMFVWVSQMGKILTPEQGTFNHLWAISTPRSSIKQGAFYEPVGQLDTKDNSNSKNPKLGPELWEWTEKELERWMD